MQMQKTGFGLKLEIIRRASWLFFCSADQKSLCNSSVTRLGGAVSSGQTLLWVFVTLIAASQVILW